ncbi:unnamed protein product [Rhizoctonia solani]|uniref:Uncharacterized protein n=1 Tax=Rhizoctonia solani TaxID=456999 RepID=A0A8H3CJY8_9AGAM|nr:unnamed protein product [Rhizoctonia solani]CAE6481693.1 unnamed protein product [Rhizoctonia solani]
MSEEFKAASRDKKEGSQESPVVSEPPSTPSSSAARAKAYLSTASDGRVTLTFPSSGAWSGQYQALSPQPARYEPATPASELSIGENNLPNHEKTIPLKLMTDESLAAVLDSSNTESGDHSNTESGDLEAWIESSKQTIIRQSDQGQHAESDDKS